MNPKDGIGRALGRIPSGLFVLTAGRGSEATGILASFVQQVGFDPPALCVAVKKGRSIEDLIRREQGFCIAVLDGAGKKLMGHFARGFDPGEPAFTGLEMRTSEPGIPYPAAAQAFLACRLVGEAADWSDHTVFCGEVVGGEGRIDQPPLFHVRKNGFQYLRPVSKPMTVAAIVTAAGAGRRMGQDKALLDLGGSTAVQRVVEQCRDGGVEDVLVVRARGALPLPPLPASVSAVPVDGKGEMADSIRAALLRLGPSVDRVIVFPVDHALVMADTVLALHSALGDGTGIALPLFRGRPGHPVAFRRAVIEELRATATLRDVVHQDPSRVRPVPTANAWVCCDLDRPEDLRAARAALVAEPWSVVEQMHRHRSRRAYRPEPLPQGQLDRLVDAARCASTSSYIQAYAVVAVQEPGRKAEVAALCSDQEHIRQAPVFLAICADLHKLGIACQQHGTQLQSQSLELFLQATVDAALLGQNLQLAAESEGLGACMIGAARNHPIELARLLALPAHAFVVFGMTVGIAADDPVGRGRMPLAGILHRETYDPAASEAAMAGADAVIRAWAVRTNAERGGYQGRPVDERKGWAERMAQLWGEQSRYVKSRTALRSELGRLGFGLE